MFTASIVIFFSFSLSLEIVPKYYTMSIHRLITRKINKYYCIVFFLLYFKCDRAVSRLETVNWDFPENQSNAA